MKKLVSSCLVVMGLVLTVSTRAGDLDPSWGPQSGSGMYTMSEVYYYLTEGRERSIADSFQEPSAGPASTMKTLKEIYDDIKAKFEQCGATPGQVLSTASFFNTDTDNWGPQSGSVEPRILSDSSTTVEAGYYEQTDLSVVDSDLTTANIKATKNIFGIAGDTNVVDTSDATAVTGDILDSKTAYVTGNKVTGSITTMASFTGAEGAITFTVPDGYYDGSTTSTARDNDLAAGNIKGGENIFGTTGTFPSDGTAAEGEVKTGKFFYTDSSTQAGGGRDEGLVGGQRDGDRGLL